MGTRFQRDRLRRIRARILRNFFGKNLARLVIPIRRAERFSREIRDRDRVRYRVRYRERRLSQRAELPRAPGSLRRS